MEFVELVQQLRRELERIQSAPCDPTGSEVLRLMDGIIRALELQMPH